MFKQGGRLKSSGPKAVGVSSRRDDQMLSIVSTLERKVANCLGCGKIFDCRTTSNEVIRFLEGGGTCTFCGRKVALNYRGNGDDEASDTAASQAGPDATSSDQQAGSSTNKDAATAAAIAFKNRLVDYDRNSAKRTAVIDDQSDYFEVDTNTWLSDQERAQMRKQRQLEEEAEAARRSRVAVTIDLLGRRVLVADAAESDGRAASFRTGGDALAAPYDPRAIMFQGDDQPKRPAQSAEEEQAGDVYGPQGTPLLRQQVPEAKHLSAEEAAARAAREVEALRHLRISANPDLAGRPTPSVRPHHQQDGQDKPRPAPKGDKGARGRTRFGPSRLQQDVDDVFNSFGAEIVYEDVEAAIVAAESGQAFDLCPFDGAPQAAPSKLQQRTAASIVSAGPKASHPQQPEVVDPSSLPPGVVLLRGWLSIEEQVEVIRVLRDLGKGPGGFYTPSYGPGQSMHLRMMCLGKHWEPRSHSYEDVRSSHDGAIPPMIPPILHDACVKAAEQCLQVSQREQGVRMPSISPDICLVNYYEKSGRLGLHQDKDESSDSLRQGIPVVSFSIGDTADFVMSRTHDEEPQTLQLCSGDALVFGGPSRMIYHGVPKVYPGTAPAQLLEATGMRAGRINLTFRQL
ncbi:2OG-Fe(II) oxygenase superfamily-domain-containing protein [Dunaliella salina]|nr:2OG-Fe(II) oxygenase superfamily-domain-containing protein [Dunaliella salina]|eukprot:KAF5840213.1 2OG-Fe(II) oxygenase superfamily-domain-containing protein [Dunaliella salina]